MIIIGVLCKLQILQWICLKSMANTDRLMLLCQLSQREKSVSELEACLNLRQPSLSQQLTVLREAQLVSTRREGKNVYYSIGSPAALVVIRVLHDEFCRKDVAPRLKSA